MTAFGIAVRWLHLACSLGLIGLVTALLLAGRSDRPTALAWEARTLRWARGLTGLLLVSGLAALAYQTAVVTGRADAALDPVAWAQLLARSQFGTVWLVRHGLLLLLAALLLLREREQSGADRLAFRGEAWLLAAVGAGAMAWAGHAAAVEPRGLPAALLVVSDRSHDDRPLNWIHAQAFQDSVRQHRAGVLVVHTADEIPNVVHVGSNRGQLCVALRMPQSLQRVIRDVGRERGVPCPVLRIPDRACVFVGLVDIGFHFGIAPDIIQRYPRGLLNNFLT